MNQDDYFNRIIDGFSNKESKIIRILIARGFLIDLCDGHYYISKDASDGDSQFLAEKMIEYKIGRLNGRELQIDSHNDYRAAEALFLSTKNVGYEACNWIAYMWDDFISRSRERKADVQILEPFISYYVKAISVCGVDTCSSCDGNPAYHTTRSKKVRVESYTLAHRLWHKWIWEHIVVPEFGKLPFIEKGILIREEYKFEVYYKLYCIADYLYKKRFLLRELKHIACVEIFKNYSETNSDEEIAERFLLNCDREWSALNCQECFL